MFANWNLIIILFEVIIIVLKVKYYFDSFNFGIKKIYIVDRFYLFKGLLNIYILMNYNSKSNYSKIHEMIYLKKKNFKYSSFLIVFN